MADYRYFKCKFWSDPYIRELKSDERMIYIWLFTNEHTSQAGIYSIHESTIAVETGYDQKRICEILSKFSKDNKIVYTDQKILWVKNFLRHQPNKSTKVLTRIATDLKETNDPDLVQKFLIYYDTLSIPYGYPMDTPSNKEEEKEKEEEEEKEKGEGKSAREEKPKIPPNLPFKIRDKIILLNAEIKTQKRTLKEKKSNVPDDVIIANIREIEKNIQDLLDASNL